VKAHDFNKVQQTSISRLQQVQQQSLGINKIQQISISSGLLNNFERVGDAARPEGIPDLINLTANFAGKHRVAFGNPEYYLNPLSPYHIRRLNFTDVKREQLA